MSLILKGIDLPRNGDCHHITIYDNGNTYITTSNILYETDRKDVEAIQIPKGHGDIKDVGKIDIPSTSVDMFENCGNCNLLDDEQVKEIIHNAPTILESED